MFVEINLMLALPVKTKEILTESEMKEITQTASDVLLTSSTFKKKLESIYGEMDDDPFTIGFDTPGKSDLLSSSVSDVHKMSLKATYIDKIEWTIDEKEDPSVIKDVCVTLVGEESTPKFLRDMTKTEHTTGHLVESNYDFISGSLFKSAYEERDHAIEELFKELDGNDFYKCEKNYTKDPIPKLYKIGFRLKKRVKELL